MEGVRILLVRHGETVWNQENRWQGQADVPLSDNGRDQSWRLARRLEAEKQSVQAIYTSDLIRAVDTAMILGQSLGVEPTIETGWREMNIGTWSGLRTGEVIARHPEEWERLRAGEDLPRGGGETFAHFQSRLIGAARSLINRHPGQQVAVVTHGGAVRAFLLYCRGLAMREFRKIDKIGNTGLSKVTLSADGRSLIHYVNNTSHLDGVALSGETVDA